MADFNFLRTWRYWSKFIIVLLVVSAGVWFLRYWISKNTIRPSHTVAGQVLSVGDSQIMIRGFSVTDNNPQDSGRLLGDIIVKIDSNTKFIKTIWPASGEAGQPIQSAGSLADLAVNKSVIVKTAQNSAGLAEITATEIDYNVQTARH